MAEFDILTDKGSMIPLNGLRDSSNNSASKEKEWWEKFSDWFYAQNDRMTTQGAGTLAGSTPAGTETINTSAGGQKVFDNISGDNGVSSMVDVIKGTDNPIKDYVDPSIEDALSDLGSSASTPVVNDNEAVSNFTSSQVNSALNASSSMEAMKILAETDPAYMEKYLDNLYNMEQMNSARQYDKEMSNTAFSRLIDDIKSKGYNPWLALQNGVSQASAGGLSHAASSSVGSSSQATSRYNTASKNQTSIMTALINLYGNAISSVMKGLISMGNFIGKLVH